MPRPPSIFSGDTFGRWTVLETGFYAQPTPSQLARGKRGGRQARCRCVCGVEALVREAGLRSGTSTSCGCYNREVAVAAMQQSRLTEFSEAGARAHPLYWTWEQMKRRCDRTDSKDYVNYGGRGISYTPAWTYFSAFRDDIDRLIGPRPHGHTLDREDNDGNYEPGNVRWSTAAEQRRNQRMR